MITTLPKSMYIVVSDSLPIMLTKSAQQIISKAYIVKGNKTLSKFPISPPRMESNGNICYAG